MAQTVIVPQLDREDSDADSRTLLVSPTPKPTLATKPTLSTWTEDKKQ